MAVRKRISTFLVVLALICALAASAQVSAADASTLRLERAFIQMPEFLVLFQLENGIEQLPPVTVSEISATLDGKPLSVNGVTRYDGGTLYIFMVDVSGSIRQAQTDAAKRTLIDFHASMQPQDRMVLIAFGEDVTILLDGSESDEEALEQINTLHRRHQSTHFFDGVNAALSIAENKTSGLPDRSVAFIISDGLDDTDGGGYTKNEVIDRIKQSELPIYAVGFSNTGSNTEKQALESFGELARSSGGQFLPVTADTLTEAIQTFDTHVKNVQVAHLSGENNVVDFQPHTLQLSVERGGTSYAASASVTPASWIPDREAPAVTSGPVQAGSSAIRIGFSKPLAGADNKDNYIVTSEDGTAVALQNAEYDPVSGTVELTFDGQPYTGTYTLSFSGITDVSMEENRLAGEYTFTFDGRTYVPPPDPPPGGSDGTGTTVQLSFIEANRWVVFVIVLLVVAVVAVVIFFSTLKGRKSIITVDGKIGYGDAVEFKHHFETPPDSKRASLIVTDMTGAARQIELDIYGSFFVGRSEEINNLSFDDGKLSRQHFVIEADDDGFYISDLNSTNGTFLNGVKLVNKRKLNDKDTIKAGNEKFVFDGNQF